MATSDPHNTDLHNDAPEMPQDPVEQAAWWHTLLQTDSISEQQQRAFQHWYAQPDNAALYERLDSMWQRIDHIESGMARSTVTSVLSQQQAETQTFSRHLKGAGAGLGILLLAGLVTVHSFDKQQQLSELLFSGRLLADHSTAVGEVRTLTLDDNTRLQLNTFSSVDIDYSPQRRVIHLLQGEIQLDVAPDHSRPLIVINGQASARALGTRFSVRDMGTRTDVAVTESQVEVCAQNSGHCQRLNANQTSSVHRGEVSTPAPLNPGVVMDWDKRLLLVDDQPLLSVLDELNRHHSGLMRIDRDALQHYRVSGVFAVNNLPASLQVIGDTLPVRITHISTLVTLITAE